MATPAYVPLNPNTPSGPTQSPDAYSASDLANVRALRDAIIIGAMPGWAYSWQGGSADRPQNRVWANGALRLLMQCTYSGPLLLPTTIGWYWSNDSAASYIAMWPNSTVVWDANAFITSVNDDAGLWVSWLAAYSKAMIVGELLSIHNSSSGTGAHGLGTMSTQNANAVAITGGSVVNATLSQNQLQYLYRIFPVAVADLASGVAWNWGSAGIQLNIPAGANIPNIIGPLAGEVKRLWVTTAGAITIGTGGGVTFAWATGHPVWNAAGGTLVCCVAITNGFVLGTTVP